MSQSLHEPEPTLQALALARACVAATSARPASPHPADPRRNGSRGPCGDAVGSERARPLLSASMGRFCLQLAPPHAHAVRGNGLCNRWTVPGCAHSPRMQGGGLEANGASLASQCHERRVKRLTVSRRLCGQGLGCNCAGSRRHERLRRLLPTDRRPRAGSLARVLWCTWQEVLKRRC